jgi:uncharacterized protein YehS (DUF1456 family)
MVELFAKGGVAVTKEQVVLWLKKDDDPDYLRCTDQQFSHFLNGLIIEKRGPREDGEVPVAEYALNNNIILRKLKIAFNLKDQDILDLLKNANFILGKAELSAFFRNPEHRHFREAQDQVLRNVLQGLQQRETNTSTAEQQSQYQAIQSKVANKKAAARKEKNNTPGSERVNPYAKDKPSGEKVVYQNPKKAAKEEAPSRAKISLKKDDKKQSVPTPETKKPTVQVVKKAPSQEANNESTSNSENQQSAPTSNGGFTWNKPSKND